MYCSNSSPIISNCIVNGNTIVNACIYSYLGSPTITNNIIHNTGGIGVNLAGSNTPVIKNNWIYDADGGISIYDACGVVLVSNNTIVDCEYYGIKVNLGTEPSISNCIIWNCNDDLLDSNATYSCIEDSDSGVGNINDVPLFVDDGNDNYRIGWNSLCIDAADGDVALTTDIFGNSRYDDPNTANTGAGEPNFVDIGAYEYQYP